jgi:D-alanine-D-alanine ligase
VPGSVTDLVAKPAEQGSSVGIEIVKNDDAGWEAIMAQAEKFRTMLVEERIFGRELTCAVVGLGSQPVALPLVEIRPKEAFYNYTAKYTKGASEYICPAPLNENLAWQVQQHAMQIYREFELSPYARIDCLLDASGVPWFLEANTLPGFTELSLLPMAARTAGLDYAALLELLLALAWRRWQVGRGGAS